MTTAPDIHWESWRRLRDPASFEALVRPELGRALSFARSLGCSDADAEDVLQESLVRLAAERGDGPSRIGVRAWLYRTVRDRARSRRRSWWRRRDREAKAARPEAAPPRTGDLEVREQVEQALAALPDAEREAVRLRYLQDLDYRDMAHVLGVSENACRIRVHRALETLKKRFGAGVATMVAALTLPTPAHSDHLLREVLRGVAPEAVKATVAVGWKIAGAAAVVAGVAVVATLVVPGVDVPMGERPPHPLVTAAAPEAGATVAAGGGGTPVAAAGSVAPAPTPTGTAAGGAPAVPGPPPPSAPTAADAVALLEGVASIGWDFGLRTSAAEVYGTILRIDPDHKVAAERVKTDDGDSPMGEKERKAFDERLDRASAEAARILSGLGTAMAAVRDSAGAKEQWNLALLVHGQDPVANERLRSLRTPLGWASRRCVAHLEFEQERIRGFLYPRTPGIRDSARSTGLPAAAGIAVLRMESDHFLVEADLPARQVSEILEALEAVHGSLRDLFRLSDRPAGDETGRREYVLLSARDYYERVVDASDTGTADEKAAAKRAPSWRCSPDRLLAFVPDVRAALPSLVHGAAHDRLKASFGSLDPWLDVALANLASCPVLGSEFSLCPGDSPRAASKVIDKLLPENAPTLLRSLVLRRRDLPMETLVGLPADRLDAAGLAKAWSVVLFLLETDGNAAKEFLLEAGLGSEKRKATEKILAAKGLGKSRNPSELERALSRRFQDFKTWKDLDAAWRAWALDVYRR